MAKECIIIGQPNVGKTLFLLKFAEFLGCQSVNINFSRPGNRLTKSFFLDEAQRALVSEKPHNTLCHQSIEVRVPVGKGKKRIILTDTGGLSEGIHKDAEVRKAMAFTIAKIRNAKLIIHLIDASDLGNKGAIAKMSELDFQIAQFAKAAKGFLILANKMDLPNADLGCRLLKEEFIGVPVIPISALTKYLCHNPFFYRSLS